VSVLVVADPIEGLDPQVDATVGLAAAAIELDTGVWVCGPEQLSVQDGRVRARASLLTLAPRRRGGDHRWLVPRSWFALGPPRDLDVAAEVDLVLLRIDPPVDGRYLRTTYLLDLVELAGTRVVNRPEGVRALHEKAIALQFPDLAPPTLVTADPFAVRRFVRTTGTSVVKPFDGFAGRDVWLLRDDTSCTALAESATHGGARQVIVQPYLAGVADGNKRLFVLDGEILEAVTRRPAADDFRIGPPVARSEVDAHDRAIARALAPLLQRHGIALAGIDVIAGLLIEVNVTCPGGMAKADALLGTNLSGAIVGRLLDLGATRHRTDKLSREKEEVPA
jgi:glutathione synthase